MSQDHRNIFFGGDTLVDKASKLGARSWNMQKFTLENEEKLGTKPLKRLDRSFVLISQFFPNFFNQLKTPLTLTFLTICFLCSGDSTIALAESSESDCEITGEIRLCHGLTHIESTRLSVPRPLFSKYPLPTIRFEFVGYRTCSLGEIELRVDFEFTMAGIIDEAVSDYTSLMKGIIPSRRELERYDIDGTAVIKVGRLSEKKPDKDVLDGAFGFRGGTLFHTGEFYLTRYVPVAESTTACNSYMEKLDG